MSPSSALRPYNSKSQRNAFGRGIGFRISNSHLRRRMTDLPRSLTRRDLLRSGLALSGTALVAGPVGRAQALLARYPGVASAEAQSAVAPREHLLFDFGWKFFQGHASDPLRDLGFGMGQGDFAKSGEFWFATAKFDDSKWRDLNLPHDWAVELPFVHDEEQTATGINHWAAATPRPAWAGTGARSIFRKKTADGASWSSSTARFAARWCF